MRVPNQQTFVNINPFTKITILLVRSLPLCVHASETLYKVNEVGRKLECIMFSTCGKKQIQDKQICH